MPHYPYLILGGGMAGAAAARGIRELDQQREIGLIGAEHNAPYKRPPLSKGLWTGKPIDKVWISLEGHGVEQHLGRSARSLDVRRKQVVDDEGTVYTFDSLLIATGSTPRRFAWGGDQVIYFRTLSDYQRLRALADQGRTFAIIGGGFIGAEIAAALTQNQKDVVMVFPDAGIGERIFGTRFAQHLNDLYRQKGVTVLERDAPSSLDRQGDRLLLKTEQGRDLLVDGVVAGIGVEPNTALAQTAGLEVDNGIVVDALLRAGHPYIYAAGDVANFYNPLLEQRMRVEHEDNALTMGGHAGRNMAGAAEPYTHLPFFYSDLFDLGYEAVGQLDARLERVEDWREPYREGIVYYLAEGRVRGVLLWNVWGQVEAARQLIAESEPIRAEDLRGRLPA